MLRRNALDAITGLQGGTIPHEHIAPILKANAKDELAGLSFNVPAELGRQLLLGDSILHALEHGDAEELKRIESINSRGFWAVLEDLATTQLVSGEPRAIANSATCLKDSRFLETHEREELDTAVRVVCDAAEHFAEWDAFDLELAKGIVALCELRSDETYSTTLVSTVSATLEKLGPASDSEESTHDPIELTDSVLLMLSKLTLLGHAKAFGSPLTLPLTADQWIQAADHLFKQDATRQCWKFVRPRCEFAAISTLLQETVVADNLGTAHANAITVTHVTPMKKSWAEFVTVLLERLDASQGVGVQPATFDTYVLSMLSRWQVKEASAALRVLAEKGHLLHHFHATATANHRSWIAFAFLRERPGAEAPIAHVGRSEAGHAALLDYLASDDDENAEEFGNRIMQFACRQLPFEISDERGQYDELIITCVRKFADSETPQTFFQHDIVRSRWQELPTILDDGDEVEPRFTKLLTHLVSTAQLANQIAEDGDGFVPQNAGLYRRILAIESTAVEPFRDWCRDRIGTFDEEVWMGELSGETETLDLVLELLRHGVDVDLKTNFKDALVAHGRSILDSTQSPPDRLRSDWPTLIDAIGSSGTRKDLANRLLDATIERSGEFPSEFLELYGEEIADIELLLAHQRVISDLFTLIVKNRDVRALSWLARIADKQPEFLERYQIVSESGHDAEAETEEFVVRLKEYLTNEVQDEAQELIGRIATSFGVEPDDKAEVGSEDAEESE